MPMRITSLPAAWAERAMDSVPSVASEVKSAGDELDGQIESVSRADPGADRPAERGAG